MAQIGNNEWREARKTLHRVLMKDPHYAKAHFRLAQIALLNRNMGFAQGEYELALADASRLGPREEKLTRIGLAIATNDRETARTTARGMRADFPNDPDLERIVRTFPGMFGGGVGGGRGDGQRRFPGRP